MYTPEEMPDEQQQTEHKGEANKTIPQFQEQKQIDAPAPEQVADKEPPEFTPDPEPEQVADKEPKEFTHWAGEKSFEFDPPIKVPVQKDEVDPAGENLPWEQAEQTQDTEDENDSLFKL